VRSDLRSGWWIAHLRPRRAAATTPADAQGRAQPRESEPLPLRLGALAGGLLRSGAMPSDARLRTPRSNRRRPSCARRRLRAPRMVACAALAAWGVAGTGAPAWASAPPGQGIRVVWVSALGGSTPEAPPTAFGRGAATAGAWPAVTLSDARSRTAPSAVAPAATLDLDVRGRRLPSVSSGPAPVRREASPWPPQTPLPR